jgi:hypothetical protein
MLSVYVYVHAFVSALFDRASDERGQSTAEYALVMLGAAAIAMLVVTWAGKTDLIGKLLSTVLGKILP